jgi:ATP-dependent Zn protease
MGVPDEAARAKILEVHAKRLKISGDFDYLALARKTPGYHFTLQLRHFHTMMCSTSR